MFGTETTLKGFMAVVVMKIEDGPVLGSWVSTRFSWHALKNVNGFHSSSEKKGFIILENLISHYQLFKFTDISTNP